MNRIEAWNIFAHSGRVEDYLKYKEITDEAEHGRADNSRISDGRG